MHPRLIDIHGFPIGTYGLMLAVGFYLALLVTERRARLFGIPRGEAASLAVWILIAGIVGARFWYIAISWSEFVQRPLDFILSRGDLVFFGGILGGTLAAVLWSRRRAFPVWEVGDWVAPGVALGHAFGRIGCFLNGCCFGRRSALPWAVRFPEDSYAFDFHLDRYPDALDPGASWSLPVHPVQLYSFVFLLALSLFLFWMTPRRRFSGQVFWWYAVIYASYRFLVEFLRADLRGMIGPLSSSQVLCLLVLLASPVWYLWLKRRAWTRVESGTGQVVPPAGSRDPARGKGALRH